MRKIRELEWRIEELEREQRKADKMICDYMSEELRLINKMSEQISAMQDIVAKAMFDKGIAITECAENSIFGSGRSQ